jgi:hypothetical protein
MRTSLIRLVSVGRSILRPPKILGYDPDVYEWRSVSNLINDNGLKAEPQALAA